MIKQETDRLIIRPVHAADKHEIFICRSDKQANKFQGWIPETIEDVADFIAKTASQINQPDTWFQLVIIEKSSQKLIGDMGLHFISDENKQVEIGCTLHKDFQNKGYATEALKTVITFLFNDLQKHRITTSIDPQNQPSIRLVERLGFRKEAHFVKSLWLNGQWCDDVVYALLGEEWE